MPGDPASPGRGVRGGISNPFSIALIVVLGLLAYSNTFHVPFQFDDVEYVKENPIIKDFRHLLNPIGAMGLDLPTNVRESLPSRYAGYLSFAVNYRIHGLGVEGYHAGNLLIHLINASLVYWLVLITFRTPFLRSSRLARHSGLIAISSALLFVAHPVQTQAVTYISQRFTVLVTAFYLLSLLLYIKYRTDGGRTYYGLSLLCAMSAMVTKEIAFTLPVSIALYEFLFLEGKRGKRLLLLVPFAFTMLLVPACLLDRCDSFAEMIDRATRAHTDIPRKEYFLTQPRVLLKYLGLLVLPLNQNVDYDFSLSRSLWEPSVLGSAGVLAMIVLSALYLHVRSGKGESALRVTAFGLLWFFVTLSVESGVIPLADVINEHRLYLATVWLIPAVVTAFVLALSKPLTGKWVTVFWVLVALVAAVLAGASYKRNAVWRSEASLWEDVVRKSPLKARGHNNLGKIYCDLGLAEKALEHYRTAISIEPGFAGAHFNLGNSYMSRGMEQLASKHYMAAIALSPDFAEAYNNLGTVYMHRGDLQLATQHFEKSLSLKPTNATAHFNLAALYSSLGQTDRSIEQLKEAVRLKPDYLDAHLKLGVLYLEGNSISDACREFQVVLKLDPENPDAARYLSEVGGAKGLDSTSP